jgi:hypothetical protein
VARPGTVLTLFADSVPACMLRVSRPGPTHQRIQTPPRVRHIDNYARVTVTGHGILAGAPGELTLASGTRLILFDIKVERGEVRFFPHAAEPVTGHDGRSVYGCTEFVFPLEAGQSARSSGRSTVSSRCRQDDVSRGWAGRLPGFAIGLPGWHRPVVAVPAASCRSLVGAETRGAPTQRSRSRPHRVGQEPGTAVRCPVVRL